LVNCILIIDEITNVRKTNWFLWIKSNLLKNISLASKFRKQKFINGVSWPCFLQK